MLKLEENIPLKKYTTFDIGGPARYLCEVHSLDDLNEVLNFDQQNSLPILFLGGGSNILISDDGFPGLVIVNRIKGLEQQSNGVLKVFSGEVWDDVVKAAVDLNWAGIESLSGIPGTAGGALVQNIGAYGQTVSDRIGDVWVLNTESKTIEKWSKDQCQFEYRNSYFKSNPGKYFVLSFELKLTPNGAPETSYPDVARYMTEHEIKNLSQAREAIIKIRAAKGYVIIPGYASYKSAGSFFKNPVVSSEVFHSLVNKIESTPTPWFWELPDGRVKIAAARLLASAGFEKGFALGGAGISPKHSLALINLGNSNASQILEVADLIKSSVYEKYGVELENEVQLVGYFN